MAVNHADGVLFSPVLFYPLAAALPVAATERRVVCSRRSWNWARGYGPGAPSPLCSP